jgi:putative acetyltransferase
MDSVTIRPSRPDEGPRLVEIWAAAVDATHGFLSAGDRVAIEREVDGFLPRAEALVAVDGDDLPIGFMILDGDDLAALFIDAKHHAKGVGGAMVTHALAGRRRLTVDVNEQNAQAVGFYEHLGFRVTGRSELDGQGRAYPLLHMRLSREPA